MKKHEIIELLKRSHAELESVTNRYGCAFKTAVVLVDCENALIEIEQPKQKPAAAIVDGLSLVH